MSHLDDLQLTVQQNESAQASAEAFVSGIARRILDTNGDQASVLALGHQLRISAADFAKAIVANTPVDPNPAVAPQGINQINRTAAAAPVLGENASPVNPPASPEPLHPATTSTPASNTSASVPAVTTGNTPSTPAAPATPPATVTSPSVAPKKL